MKKKKVFFVALAGMCLEARVSLRLEYFSTRSTDMTEEQEKNLHL